MNPPRAPEGLPGSERLRRAAALTVVVAALLIGAAAEATLSLSMHGDASVPVGENPRSFTAADCDGDAFPDLVAGGQNSSDVIGHLNRGGGTFEFDRRVLVGSQPTGAACSDFDGDGQVDIVALSRDGLRDQQGNILGGLLNFYKRSGESYALAGSRQVGFAPIALAAGDINHDQRLDFVVVNENSHDMTQFLGTGTGVPAGATTVLPTDNPRAAAIADFVAGGNLDVAVASQSIPGVVVMRNIGVYSPIPTVEAFPEGPPGPGIGVAGGDISGDGKIDLAFLSTESVITLYTGDGSGHFTFRDAFSVAPVAEAVHLADFDQDGDTDLAVLYRESNSIEVFLADGHGNFAVRSDAPIDVPLGPAFNSQLAMQARVNAGPPPVTHFVRVNESARSVQLVTQTSPGVFGVAGTTQVPSSTDVPKRIVLADMNGDEVLDAVVGLKLNGRGARDRSAVLIFPGNGSGGFDDPASGPATCGDGAIEGGELCDDGNLKSRDGCSKTCVPEVGREVVSLAAAELSGDGAMDLVVVDTRGYVTVLLGDDQGRFLGTRSLGKAKRRAPVALGDFTGEGAVDVALVPTSRRLGAVTLMLNSGGANFTPRAVGADAKLTGPLLAADLDHNGTLDLAVGMKDAIAVFANDGAGPARLADVVPAPKGVASIGAADFDSDGRSDLIASFVSSKATSTLLFSSIAGFQFGSPSVVSNNRSFVHPTILDLNGDSHHDLVACDTACAALFGNGLGGFGPPPLTVDASIGPEVRGAAAADFDCDGEVDVVGVSKALNRAVVIFGAEVDPQGARLELPTGGDGPTVAAAADFNADGCEDLLVLNEDSQNYSLFIYDCHRQPGQGCTPDPSPGFLAPSVVRFPNMNGVNAVSLAVADIDGDGSMDFAVTQGGDGTNPATVTPLLFTGSGFAGLPVEVGADPRGVAIGNLNGDAVLDLVTANRAGNSVSVLLSKPTGGYARTDFASGGLRPSGVAALDLNGDGIDDVVAINEKVALGADLGNAVVFINDGAGAFAGPSSTHVRGRETPRSICAGRFDDDDQLDVAIGSFDSSDILVLHGSGSDGFRTDERTFAVGKQVSAITCRDADSDGLDDIAFARQNGGDVGVILSSETD